ncbi:MAG: lipopolysaccharide heptosyltransferase family protein [Verrucomicrobia bacterium]|nr:MAG: lipopolysaccharide heptosyltransferase family protein [Verrucomicrobiota bacterium]
MTPDFKKILVLALAGAGDTLMATPFLKELRLACPHAQIDVLVLQGAVAHAVLDGNPNLNRLMLYDFVSEGRRRSLQFCLDLRREKYDVSFSLMPQNRFEYNLIARLIGARERIGFDYAVKCGALSRWLLTRTLREDESLHLADSNLRLLPEALDRPLQLREHHLEIAVQEEHRAAAERFIQTHHLQGRRLIGFHPGSGTTKNLVLKRWGMVQWATLGRQLCEKYPDATLLLFGSKDEESLRAEIRTQSPLPAERLVDGGNLALKESAALLGKMQIMVCIDGLPAHLAAAQGVPCVALFGPTPPTATRPYGVPHRIARLDLPCSPCYRYSRRGIRCINPNFLQCLHDLAPATVATLVDELLREVRTP